MHWFGSDRDAQLPRRCSSSQSTHLPRGKAVSVAGLHHEIIAYPGGRIGDANYVYVPGKSAVHADRGPELSKAQPTFDHNAIVEACARCNRSDDGPDPLAWFAIAPLRSRLTQFPILAVTGGSGTARPRSCVRWCATSRQPPSGRTSPARPSSPCRATSHRPTPSRCGSTTSTARRPQGHGAGVQPALRDAYTGRPSIKGRHGDHWSSVSSIPVACPIIVSGEDSSRDLAHRAHGARALPLDGRTRS